MPANRRSFLKTTGAVAAAFAAPTLFPSRVLGANDRIRVGMIGVGNQGMGNVNRFLPFADVVAVCDVDSTRRDAARERVRKTSRPCEAHTDFRKLLDSKDVDAVVVTTPDHWHAMQTVLACQAGKDVYCEKPLTLTVREGRRMVEEARRNNRIVQTGSQQRSDAKFRLACELVRSGRIGKVREVHAGISGVNYKGPPVPDSDPPKELDFDLWLGPAPKRAYNRLRVHYQFRFFWDYSGGQQTNWGAHNLDIAQWGLGTDDSGPLEISAAARFEEHGWYEVPKFSRVTYRYPNDVTVIAAMDVPGGATFIGEKGKIHVTRKELKSDPPEIVRQALKDGDVHLYKSNNHVANFIDCIKSRKTPICDVEIGHRSATVCHLGNIAIRSGRTIRWDPSSEQILGDADAAAMLERPYRAPWRL